MKNKSIAKNIKRSHSRIAHKYAGGISSGIYHYKNSKLACLRWESKLFNRIFSAIFSEIQLPKSAVFLDAGCGNGQWIEYFAKKFGFSNFIAADFSSSMLEYTKQRMKNISVKIKYVQSDLESIKSLESKSVDIIHFFGVIEHLDHPERVINEFNRILKNNGYLIINCPIKYSFSYFSFMLFAISPQYWGLKPHWKMRLDFKSKLSHYRFYSKKQLAKWLLPGFDIIQKHNTSFSHAVSYAGLLYKYLPVISFTLQDIFDFICRLIFLNRPSGVYWLAQKTKIKSNQK